MTYTGTTFSWLFPTAPGAPVKGVLTVNHDTAESVSNSVLVYDMLLQVKRSDGGKVPFVMKMRFDQAP